MDWATEYTEPSAPGGAQKRTIRRRCSYGRTSKEKDPFGGLYSLPTTRCSLLLALREDFEHAGEEAVYLGLVALHEFVEFFEVDFGAFETVGKIID